MCCIGRNLETTTAVSLPSSASMTCWTAMNHRGPDSRGKVGFPGGATGMVRLALVDPTPRRRAAVVVPVRQSRRVFNGESKTFVKTAAARIPWP